jgi:hypothetical protein
LGPEFSYLSVIGALMYLANNTRPDIAFAVNLLTRHSATHIIPCEDIKIFLEKSDECEFLFGVKTYADAKLLVQVIEANWDFFVYNVLVLVVPLLIGGLRVIP